MNPLTLAPTAALPGTAPVAPALNIPTNPAAPVKASQYIRIGARPEKVWAVLTDINAWAAWQADIRKPRLHGKLQPGTTFDWATGGASIRSTLHTVEPARRFGWTGKTFGMYAVHNWVLTAKPDGSTEVEVTETMEGLLARVFKASFNRNLAGGMQRWLHFLKAEAEK
ncbi:MAG: SRPBCC family protein [Hymenobacter sp.]|nr:SRPBCC family protein [Hymenobacter sp.]